MSRNCRRTAAACASTRNGPTRAAASASPAVAALLERERAAGLAIARAGRGFQQRADRIKDDLVAFLIEQKRAGRTVAAYGAAAKGNTLLNFAGVRPDLLAFVADASPHKQGIAFAGLAHFRSSAKQPCAMPGPTSSSYLPWNLRSEIMQQLGYIASWGGRFVTAVPELAAFMSRIYYTKPSITELEVAYATDAARNGWGDSCYEYIDRFEAGFKAHLGVNHAIATSSCTGALHMGLAALGIGPGDEVILGDINWIASAAPITYLGATPVFVDVLEDSWCLDPQRVEAAITPRTKAIIAVHLYGNLCDMDALLDIGRRHGLPVIEDAAEAFGSRIGDRAAGSMGTSACFRFTARRRSPPAKAACGSRRTQTLYERVRTCPTTARRRADTPVLAGRARLQIQDVEHRSGDRLCSARTHRRACRRQAQGVSSLSGTACAIAASMNPEPPGHDQRLLDADHRRRQGVPFDREARFASFQSSAASTGATSSGR